MLPLNGRPDATQTVTIDDVSRVHCQPRHWLPLSKLSGNLPLSVTEGLLVIRPASMPKRGDHFLQADYFGSYRVGSSLKWREGRARDQLAAWRGESPMVPRNQHQVSARACGLWTKYSSSLRESCQRFAELIAGDTDSTAALSDRLAI